MTTLVSVEICWQTLKSKCDSLNEKDDLADHHKEMTAQGGKLKSQKVNQNDIRRFTKCERLTQKSLLINGLPAES